MKSPLSLVRIPPNASIHRFGTPTTAPRSSALLRFPVQGWTIDRQTDRTVPQGWAIVGDAEGRRLAVETLLCRHRIHPITPPPGPFPYITSLLTISSATSSALPGSMPKPVRHLAFTRSPTSGEFTDFTARYGALQEEDRLSFRETLSVLHPPPSSADIENVSRSMRIHHLLDLPSVSLSSGQTRRARIASAMLTRPVLLLLEDPMAGLDIPSRDEVSRVLGELNAAGSMRVVLVLRGKGTDSMPQWVTDVCEVKEGEVWIGKKHEWQERSRQTTLQIEQIDEVPAQETSEGEPEGEPVVALNNVSVSYGEGTRQVLESITWNIRPQDRWHLQGANGSGKTTLLSLILGHHPRSFSLPAESLILFSKPRRSTPTPILRTLIGHCSPEIFASFPRGMGLTAMETIGSGFEGVFSRRNLNPDQRDRVDHLLEHFTALLTSSQIRRDSDDSGVNGIARRLFAHSTPPQQALLLFLRAIVGRPPLLILDEPSQGMDEIIWSKCRELLEKEWRENPQQAVIVVSHYDDEVPWSKRRGKVIQLVDGEATIW